MLDGVDISGPVNLPPPCLWRRCPVLHHDRIVSALIIQFVHRRIMYWTLIDPRRDFASVRGGQPKTDLFRRYRSAAKGGSSSNARPPPRGIITPTVLDGAFSRLRPFSVLRSRKRFPDRPRAWPR